MEKKIRKWKVAPRSHSADVCIMYALADRIDDPLTSRDKPETFQMSINPPQRIMRHGKVGTSIDAVEHVMNEGHSSPLNQRTRAGDLKYDNESARLRKRHNRNEQK